MKNMNLKDALEIIRKGKDAAKIKEIRDYMRIDMNTRALKKVSNDTTVYTQEVVEEVVMEEVVQEMVEEMVEEIIEITPINKPSDRFDVEDYIRYRDYVLENGGKPSIRDYFKAVEYYKSRA